METQRAIRRLKPDPVDDEVILRLIDLAIRAPTGSNAQRWEFIVVRDPKIKQGLARINRQVWRLYGWIGRGLRNVTREAENLECCPMAGGSLRGSPSHCCRLSEGPLHPFLAYLYCNLLRFHLSCCPKPAPGCTRHKPGCCPDYYSNMEPHLCPQTPRPTLEHHTMCSDSFGLATWALRPYDAKSCS